MKHINIFIILCLLISSITSCTINRKITFHGTPGTEIYIPEQGIKLGEIDNSGIAKIKLPRKGYIPYLLIYDHKNRKFYPCGVDYYYDSKNIIPKIINYCSFIPGPNIIVFWPVILNSKYFWSNQVQEGFRYAKEQFINPIPDAPYANTGERREINDKK